MSDITITLPSEQWDEIWHAVHHYDDCGPADEGWQSDELECASKALSDALVRAHEEQE